MRRYNEDVQTYNKQANKYNKQIKYGGRPDVTVPREPTEPTRGGYACTAQVCKGVGVFIACPICCLILVIVLVRNY